MARPDVTFQFEIINLELISFLNPIISVIYERNHAICKTRVIAASTKIFRGDGRYDIGDLISLLFLFEYGLFDLAGIRFLKFQHVIVDYLDFIG